MQGSLVLALSAAVVLGCGSGSVSSGSGGSGGSVSWGSGGLGGSVSSGSGGVGGSGSNTCQASQAFYCIVGGCNHDVADKAICVEGEFVCPSGSVPQSSCKCLGPLQPNCSCSDAGIVCSDGGVATDGMASGATAQ
jgi:hypothetical protein